MERCLLPPGVYCRQVSIAAALLMLRAPRLAVTEQGWQRAPITPCVFVMTTRSLLQWHEGCTTRLRAPMTDFKSEEERGYDSSCSERE